MGDPLRDRQSLKALLANRQIIEIAEKIGSFERLAESVERELAVLDERAIPPDWRDFPVSGRLAFGSAGAGSDAGVAAGMLEARVPAVCQRCLQAFTWRLESPVNLRFAVQGEGGEMADERTDDDREYWELPDESLQPIDIVDELLVMALPLSTRHQDSADCSARDLQSVERDVTLPFAGLRTQMEKATKE